MVPSFTEPSDLAMKVGFFERNTYIRVNVCLIFASVAIKGIL